MPITDKILKCIASKFKRLKYFHGMLLTETDFDEEQAYFREKIKLHNRMHGYGVVWGLCLAATDPPSINITLKPGFAVDCDGNEIIVCNESTIPCADKINNLIEQGKLNSSSTCYSPPGASMKLYVGIKYCECQAEPIPQYTSECSSDDLKPQFSRIKEGFAIEFYTQEELPACPEIKNTFQTGNCLQSSSLCPGARPCQSEDHAIILGSVELTETETDKITNDKIDLNDQRNYVFTPASYSPWPYYQWEAFRLNMLHTFCRESGWKDISIVIGKSVTVGIKILVEKGIDIQNVTSVKLSDIKNNRTYLDYLSNALPYAKSDEAVQLIVSDDPGNPCILFAFSYSG